MDSKRICDSKTIWVNAIMLIIAVAPLLGVSAEQLTTYVVAAIPIVNILLRFLTDAPITLTAQDVGITDTKKK